MTINGDRGYTKSTRNLKKIRGAHDHFYQLAEQNIANLPNGILPTFRTKTCQLADFVLDKCDFDAIVMVRKTTEELDAG